MTMIEININHKVRVKLTRTGRAMLRENHDRLYENLPNAPEFREKKEDAEGWSEWQLWELMHELGRGMVMGTPELPIETSIEIFPGKL